MTFLGNRFSKRAASSRSPSSPWPATAAGPSAPCAASSDITAHVFSRSFGFPIALTAVASSSACRTSPASSLALSPAASVGPNGRGGSYDSDQWCGSSHQSSSPPTSSRFSPLAAGVYVAPPKASAASTSVMDWGYWPNGGMPRLLGGDGRVETRRLLSDGPRRTDRTTVGRRARRRAVDGAGKASRRVAVESSRRFRRQIVVGGEGANGTAGCPAAEEFESREA